jgi:hypothetical protein
MKECVCLSVREIASLCTCLPLIRHAARLSRCMLFIVFALSVATACSAQYYNYPESTPVSGGGTLNYTLQVQNGYCGGESQTNADLFESFSYTPSGGSAMNLSGSIDYVYPCGYYGIDGGWDYENNNYSDDDWSNVLSFPYGNCTINFNAYEGGGGSASLSCPTAYEGYIDPKYLVLGVTYAPPGPQSFVQYTSSQGVGTTNSLSNTVSNGTSYSVSLTYSGGILGFKGGTQVGYTNSQTQTTKNSQSTTVNWSVTNTIKTYGTPTAVVSGAYTSPVDNDYDMIYVWLNPVVSLSLTSSSLQWNGYGYDANDQNGMDIVGIALGYLNGDFGAMPQDLQTSLSRAWASGQTYPSGESAALTSSDFAAIAQADPFSNSSYGPDDIGSSPPTPTTSDNRFTITACNGDNSEPFVQADPSEQAENVTCTLAYSNMTTSATDYTTSETTTYSIDKTFQGTQFLSNLALDVKSSSTLTTTTEVDSSVSQSQSTAAQLSITGLPCNNQVPYEGPCVPVYPGPPTYPIQYFIYQDDLFGTFMFAPVDYY